MITIVHDLGARRTYNKVGVGEYAWQQHCYAIGDKPPRYPVPALYECNPVYYHPQRLVDYRSMRMARISYAD